MIIKRTFPFIRDTDVQWDVATCVYVGYIIWLWKSNCCCFCQDDFCWFCCNAASKHTSRKFIGGSFTDPVHLFFCLLFCFCLFVNVLITLFQRICCLTHKMNELLGLQFTCTYLLQCGRLELSVLSFCYCLHLEQSYGNWLDSRPVFCVQLCLVLYHHIVSMFLKV